MTHTLSAKEQPLSKIFSDEYVFTIPGYQRPYSWGVEQARELLDDLLGYMQSGGTKLDEVAPYFLGSIVLIKRESAPDARVVDGQQRLTTLTLLLSAIRSVVSDEKVRAGITKRIYEQGDVVTATDNHYRVSLRERDQQFFRKYVQHEGGIETLVALNDELPDSQDRLRANARHFIEALSALGQSALVRLVQFIATRCYLVAVATPDLDSAYRIFGVLNSRGLDLSATDILKAEIVGGITDAAKRDVYTRKWEDLEEDLGRDAFGELFSHVRMIYRKAKPHGTLLKEFREHVGPPDAIAFIDSVLAPIAQAFREVTDEDYASQRHAEQINDTLRWLNRIEFKDWLPPVLAYFIRHRNDPDAMRRFLADLERLAYAMLIRKTGVNERIERFSRLTTAIEQDADLYADTAPLQLSPGEQYATYAALSGPLYATHSARALGVILLRLDALVSDGSKTMAHDLVTIEHVMPQQPKPDSAWAKWVVSPQERASWVHRLGNLALLNRKKNSAAGNYEFDRKKQAYFSKGGSCAFPLTTQVLQQSQWTVPVMEARQSELLSALERHLRLQSRSAIAPVSAAGSDKEGPLFELASAKNQLHARGRQIDGQFLVYAGSTARANWFGINGGYKALYDDLVESGALDAAEGDIRKFTQDFYFSSPSAAAAVIWGRSANGRADWLVKDTGQTLAEWERGVPAGGLSGIEAESAEAEL